MATKKAATTNKKAPAKKSAAATSTKTTKTTVTTAPNVAAKTDTLAKYVMKSAQSAKLWRALGAELLGTFLLASVVIAGSGAPVAVLFAFVGIVLILGGISGAHVNPAITIGALVTRRIGWLRAIGYIVAQCLGAALAFIVLSYFIGGVPAQSSAASAYGQGPTTLFAAIDVTSAKLVGKEWYVFFAELTGTAILGLALASVTRELKDRVAAAFTAGFGIFIALLIGGIAAGYVGAVGIINPAIAIALHAYSLSSIWPFAIYALAPVIGGVLGFVIYDLLRGKTVPAVK